MRPNAPSLANLHLGTIAFLLWLIGWPVAIAVYRLTAHVCGPGGHGPSATCTPAEDYYPTLIGMVLVWFFGLIVAGGVWAFRRTP
jgi:hypothetical protein